MVQTKHVAAFFVVLLLFLAGVIIVVLREDSQESLSAPQVTFQTAESGLGVVLEEPTKDRSIRTSLIAKLDALRGVSHEPEEAVSERETIEETPEAYIPEGALPLGDGKISRAPEVGFIYSCQQQFHGGGAFRSGDWIDGAYWYPEKKVAVDGSVPWTGALSIRTEEGARVIRSNGLPNHTTGRFPIELSDDAYQYDRNPNSISEQDVLLQLPQNPTIAEAPSCLPMGMIGISLNGVALYNGLDAVGRDAAAHEIQDSCEGHPEHTGEYHYHSESECLFDTYYEGGASTLVGYALDGFGIFASVEHGVQLGNEDLDACHGHTHTIPWDGSFREMYHYHMTPEYPFTLGCFMGTPVEVAGMNDIPTNLQNGSSTLPSPPQNGKPLNENPGLPPHPPHDHSES